MFRYFLTILLINTYSGCFGLPITQPNGPISSLLESLANRCPNLFLAQQIKSKVEDCKVFVPPYNEQQFVCLMFYDINKQLCDAETVSKLSVTADNFSKINEELEVETACDQAKSWSVTDIKEVPDYKKKVGQVFHIKIGCVKVCGVADVTSQDTNFFCKYFKWGSEILASNATSQKVQEKMTKSNLTVGNESKPGILIPTNQVIPDSTKVNINLPASINNNTQLNEPELSNVSEGVNSTLLEGVKNQNSSPGQISLQESNDEDQVKPNKEKDKLDIEFATQKTEKSVLQSPSVSPSNNAIDRPSASEIEPPKKVEDDETIKDADNNLPKNLKKTSLNEQNNPNDQPEPDYQDSLEGKDNDNEDDSQNDPDLVGEDDKPLLKQDIKQSRKFETPMSFVGEREFYPNTVPDQYATDDDHFFPFFLTGVILVVLLYILYHNKSKVSKVVLGLIVEGRQPGRRRNSRGHAYRRLDTLEQAMSASSAAPPSKIIY